MPLTATTAPARRRVDRGDAARRRRSASTVPSGSRHASCGPHAGQALGWAWKRRSAGSSYSAWHAAHIAKPAIVVAGRSYGTRRDDRVARPAVGAVGERVAVAAVGGIVDLGQAAVARSPCRRSPAPPARPTSSLSHDAEPGRARPSAIRARRRPRRRGPAAAASSRSEPRERRRSPSASPSTSMSTPALSLRTNPTSPSATACRYTNGRKPTPCTVPVTRSRVRGIGARSADARAAGRRRACRRCACRRTSVRSTTMPSGSAAISPMTAAPAPSGWARIAASAGVDLVGRHDRDDLALVGDVQRVDAEQVAGAVDRRVDRQRRLVEHDGEAGVAGQLVADRADAAAGRVAQPAGAGRGGEQRLDEPVRPAPCRSGCRPRARGRHGRASPPCRGRRSCPRRARRRPAATCSGPSVRPAGIDADARGRDEEPVGRAPADDLGVAGDDRDAGRRGRLGHVGDDGSRSSSTAKPSSITNAADSHAGRPPCTARSLTVPCTAR